MLPTIWDISNLLKKAKEYDDVVDELTCVKDRLLAAYYNVKITWDDTGKYILPQEIRGAIAEVITKYIVENESSRDEYIKQILDL